jgi:hypothetical protein
MNRGSICVIKRPRANVAFLEVDAIGLSPIQKSNPSKKMPKTGVFGTIFA